MLTKEKKLEIVDRVTKHLLTQMERAKAPGEYCCVYVTPDGKRCAVGALMTDEALQFLASKGLMTLAVRADYNIAKALVMSGVIDHEDEDLKLLIQLQLIHDRCEVEQWQEALDSLRTRVVNGEL